MKRLAFHYICLSVVILLSLMVTAGSQSAKDITYSHLGQPDGMLSQRVYSALQTGDGALWWATTHGVERYNGIMNLVTG